MFDPWESYLDTETWAGGELLVLRQVFADLRRDEVYQLSRDEAAELCALARAVGR